MNEIEAQKLIIITAPSGSGKTTIVHHLLAQIPSLRFSVSACTRSPRLNEIDGVNYHFITVENFTRKIANHEFAEFEMVYEGKYYGTLKAELQRIWDDQKYPLTDIDVQGALRLMKHYGKQAISLFIQAPSMEELKNRLIMRGTETPESLKERVDKAAEEIKYAHHFDHVIINDQLEIACQKAKTIIENFIL